MNKRSSASFPQFLLQLTFHLPISCTVWCQITATTEIMRFTCDQVHSCATSGVKVRMEIFSISIDCNKYTFTICFTLKNTLTIGQKYRNLMPLSVSLPRQVLK